MNERMNTQVRVGYMLFYLVKIQVGSKLIYLKPLYHDLCTFDRVKNEGQRKTVSFVDGLNNGSSLANRVFLKDDFRWKERGYNIGNKVLTENGIRSSRQHQRAVDTAGLTSFKRVDVAKLLA